MFNLVIRVLLPRYGKGTTLTGADLFLMEMLFKYKKVSLPAIAIKHINIVFNANDRRHRTPYGFGLNRVFAYFNIECVKVKADSVKRVFGISTFDKNKRTLRISDGKPNSLVFDLMDEQNRLKKEIHALTALLSLRDA